MESIIKKLRKGNPELLDRIWHALERLKDSERPETLGLRKKGELRDCFAWEIGRFCRVLYRPDYEAKILFIERVRSHKEVYDR